jgi:5-methylcytosine-specific restriction endonuclease McrA
MAVLRVRDQDTCRICGEPVDFSRRAPDPRAATIDHVIVLSKGGAHSYANTQLAHLQCNMAKGAD